MNHPSSMTDEELATAVRESVTSVHMTTPAEEITTRGRTIRTRRRVPLLTGALAGAAGAVLAVTALMPAGHHASQPIHAKLAAWTVVTQGNGDIRVTVRELRDPAGLQSRLRAEGLPVNVSFSVPWQESSSQPNPTCQLYPESESAFKQLADAIETGPGQEDGGDPDQETFVIHPRALADDAGLWIFGHEQSLTPPTPHHPSFAMPLSFGLVKASQECTGS